MVITSKSTETLLEVKRKVERQLRLDWEAEKEQMVNYAWKSDIEPEVYYTDDIDRLAKKKVNHQQKQEYLEEEINFILENPLPAEKLTEWYEGKKEYANNNQEYILNLIIEFIKGVK